MRRLALCALLLAGSGSLARAQQEGAVIDLSKQPAQGLPPPPPQAMLGMSLMEALISVGAADLAGVFGYLPEPAAPVAFADYLLHNHKAFKRFVKKCKRDVKESGGIDAWDRVALLYLLQFNQSPALPPGVEKLSKGDEFDVSGLVLARPLTIEQLEQGRGARR